MSIRKQLGHKDTDQLFLRVDEKPGVKDSAPCISAGGFKQVVLPLFRGDRKPEAEFVAGNKGFLED